MAGGEEKASTTRGQGDHPPMKGTLQPMNLKKDNLAHEWKQWKTSFTIYLRATALEGEEDKRKVAIFLHCLGTEALPILMAFNVDIDSIKYVELVKKFEDYFSPKKNIAIERHAFFTRKQAMDESIEEYLTVLQNLSLTCELDKLREGIVRDMFICGLSEDNNPIREQLLAEGDITLQKATEKAKAMEMSRKESTRLQEASNFVGGVQKNYQTKKKEDRAKAVAEPKSQSTRQSTAGARAAPSCARCGQVHRFKCPAMGVTCRRCQKPNHFEKMCKSQVKVQSVEVESDSDSEFFVGQIAKNSKKGWFIKMNVGEQTLKCQLDTGAHVDLMALKTWNKLEKHEPLEPIVCNVSTVSGQKVEVLGQAKIKGTINNIEHDFQFLIADIPCITILGFETCERLELVKKVCITRDILTAYKDVFEGLGCLPRVVHFEVDKSVKPVIEPNRRIPFSLVDKLKDELQRMESLGVIQKMYEPTDWVSSITLVSKANGKLRVCLDPRNLNKAVKRAHCSAPNIDDVKARLNGATHFSVLDAKNGFWMLKLDEESSKLCTFNSPFGRYRFLRMPFGTRCSSEIFQAEMLYHFGDIPGLLIYADDFLVYGDLQSHDKTLHKVLERAAQIGLKFNKEKCQFRVSSVKYLGHIFSAKGMSSDPEMVKAILDVPEPRNVKQVQSFLGMVNYLGSYIENLSQKTMYLRQLTCKDVLWEWADRHRKEFENLKQEITKTPTLAYFDSDKQLILSVDSSKDAMGACLMHGKQPIAFASTTLTTAQINYSQIEKECLALVFGCTRFSQYIYGQKIICHTDHKPLVTIMQKPLDKVPSRLQRMMLNLLKYDFEIVYVPGKEMYVSDLLSRSAVKQDGTMSQLARDLDVQVHMFKTNLSISNKKLSEFQAETKKDLALQEVAGHCKNGWPKSKFHCKELAKPYFSMQDELHVIDGLVFKGTALLVPESLKREMLKLVHNGHQGLSRSLDQVRGILFWLNMNADIKNVVESCQVCLKFRKSQTKETLMQHEQTQLPWQKVGVDLCHVGRANYLIVIDYYSQYIETALLTRTNGQAVIAQLKSIFARHGIPQQLMSDGGPPFNSREFANFTEVWDISHTMSSPYHAKSNGLVEKAVGIVKNMLIKCSESGSDPYLAMLQYRSTPKGNIQAPCQLLMSRKLRTVIPSLAKSLKPKLIDLKLHERAVSQKMKKTKEYYDRDARDLPSLEIGEAVMFKKLPDEPFVPGTVAGKCNEPRSYMIESADGVSYRRNRQHIVQVPKFYSSVPLAPSEPVPIPEKSDQLDAAESIMYEKSPAPASVSKSPPPQSRSGRTIKPPNRFTFSDFA